MIGAVRLDRLLAETGSLSEVEVETALLPVRHLGRTGDVLWRRDDTSSGLVRPLERMLAAAGSLPAADLAEGVARHWRYRKPDDAPDAEVLEAYLTGQPAYGRDAEGRWSLRAPDAARLLLAEDTAVVNLASRTSQVSRQPSERAASAAQG